MIRYLPPILIILSILGFGYITYNTIEKYNTIENYQSLMNQYNVPSDHPSNNTNLESDLIMVSILPFIIALIVGLISALPISKKIKITYNTLPVIKRNYGENKK